MNKLLSAALVLMLVAIGMTSNAHAQQVLLKKSVIGSGGMVGLVTSTGIKVSGLTGQSIIEKRTGNLDGKTRDMHQGFWVPAADTITGVREDLFTSKKLFNYPNPSNGHTTIQYEMPNSGYVTVKLYDMAGNAIKVLFDGYQNAGSQYVNWDGKDGQGVDVASGSYIYELNVSPGAVAGVGSFQEFTLRNVLVISR